jgi:PhnB protein
MPTPMRLAPILSVRRGRTAIEFYEAAFGAKVLFRIDDEGGAVVAQLSVGSAEFWVADESPEHANFSPETLSGATTRMLLIVDDPAQVWADAIAAGATEIWPVGEQHGWLVGRVVDPFGHHWEISRQLSAGQES